MGQSLSKITNWSAYNKALVQRGALTFWIDESVIEQWHCQTHHGRRGRGYTYSDEAITTALMVKGIFKLPLRALQGFINSIFNVMQIDLMSPDYSSISKRAKHIDIPIRLPTSGKVTDLVIDATGLKVYGEGEWKVKKHGADKRRTWRKLHLAVDPKSHDIVAAELTLDNVGDPTVFPELMANSPDSIKTVYADGAYDPASVMTSS